MARFYRLKLGSIYFTSDGTLAGLPCRINVGGVEGLASDYAVTSAERSNDGSVKLETVYTSKKGVELTVDILGTLTDEIFDDLAALIESAIAAGETLELEGSGGKSPASFAATVVAYKPTRAGFSGSRIKGAQFRFITT